MEGHASRVTSLEARISSVESAINIDGRQVWDDKYADNFRLHADLQAAHAEIRRLGGVIPEPCGPIVLHLKVDGEITGYP